LQIDFWVQFYKGAFETEQQMVTQYNGGLRKWINSSWTIYNAPFLEVFAFESIMTLKSKINDTIGIDRIGLPINVQ